MENIDFISAYCRAFRIDVLKISLVTMAEVTDTNIKTLSAFEHGRSKNIEHFIKYIEVSNVQQKTEFLKGLGEMMGVEHGE